MTGKITGVITYDLELTSNVDDRAKRQPIAQRHHDSLIKYRINGRHSYLEDQKMNSKISTLRRFGLQLTFIAIALFGAIGNSHACEGEDYRKTMALLDETLKLGWQCGRYNECDWDRMVELGAESQQLPGSCQSIIKEVGEALQRYNTRMETRCYGGVCCGPSGCTK